MLSCATRRMRIVFVLHQVQKLRNRPEVITAQQVTAFTVSLSYINAARLAIYVCNAS